MGFSILAVLLNILSERMPFNEKWERFVMTLGVIAFLLMLLMLWKGARSYDPSGEIGPYPLGP